MRLVVQVVQQDFRCPTVRSWGGTVRRAHTNHGSRASSPCTTSISLPKLCVPSVFDAIIWPLLCGCRRQCIFLWYFPVLSPKRLYMGSSTKLVSALGVRAHVRHRRPSKPYACERTTVICIDCIERHDILSTGRLRNSELAVENPSAHLNGCGCTTVEMHRMLEVTIAQASSVLTIHSE